MWLSWLGMLAGQIAAARQPKGLKRLILDNAPVSMDRFVQGINSLLKDFPSDLVAMLRKHEAEGTTHSKEYQDGSMVFLKKHVCTLDPWPEPLVATFATLEKNSTIYHSM
jgi:hypothetical protein